MKHIGIFVPEFPAQTHAFFWREIKVFEQMGLKVSIISTRRPADADCRHAFAGEAVRRTHYLYPPKLGGVTRGLLAGATRLHRVAAHLAKLDEGSLAERSKVAAMACFAADLLDFTRREGIEHIHTHSCADSSHIVAMAYLLGGAPFSLHLHGDLPVYGKNHRSKMRYAKFVSADARPMERQAVEIVGLPPERALTVWMGVETDRATPPADGVRQHKPFRITTVARLNPAKGHRHVLRAVARLLQAGVDCHYTIVGNGPSEADIRSLVHELQLESRVTFTGTLGEDEVIGVLRQSSALVLASDGLGEASPVAVMEAMSTGLPVICSRIGGTPDMIEDGVDGFLVEKGSVDSIVERLTALAASPALCQRIGLAARRSAVARFDVRHTAGALLARIRAASNPDQRSQAMPTGQPAGSRVGET